MGRVLVVDISHGIVCRIIKGCSGCDGSVDQQQQQQHAGHLLSEAARCRGLAVGAGAQGTARRNERVIAIAVLL